MQSGEVKMFVRLFLVAGIIAAVSTAAAAEDLSGHYLVRGTLANGTKYTLTADIVMTSETTCDVKWSDGSDGVGLLDGTTLSIGSIIHGKPQVGVYKVAADGSMEGIFTD